MKCAFLTIQSAGHSEIPPNAVCPFRSDAGGKAATPRDVLM